MQTPVFMSDVIESSDVTWSRNRSNREAGSALTLPVLKVLQQIIFQTV